MTELPKFALKESGPAGAKDLPLMRYRKQHLLEMIEELEKQLDKIARDIERLEEPK